MKSPLGIALIVAGLLFGSVAVACSGLDTGDFINVKVPGPVQKATGSGPTVSLNESEFVLEDYIRHGERFSVEIADATERKAFLDSLVNMGTELAVPFVGELPGGAILTTLLFGAGGLLVGRKSGEAKAKVQLQDAIRQAADAAWDEAEAKAVEKVRAGVEIAKGA